MKIIAALSDWFLSRRSRRARALPAGYLDVLYLHQMGLLSARATGKSITNITVEIVSRVGLPLKVTVGHGIYFVSRGNHQNMVTRAKYQFELQPLDTKRISIPAACINASLRIPGAGDRFVGVARVPENVRRFLEAAEGEDAMVVQAGVWALTDGYSRSIIQQTLRRRRVPTHDGVPLGAGNDDGPAISDAQIDRARAILDLLEIGHNL